MDSLAENHAVIVRDEKTVRILYGDEVLIVQYKELKITLIGLPALGAEILLVRVEKYALEFSRALAEYQNSVRATALFGLRMISSRLKLTCLVATKDCSCCGGFRSWKPKVTVHMVRENAILKRCSSQFLQFTDKIEKYFAKHVAFKPLCLILDSQESGYCDDLHDGYSTLFSMRIHHGGYFTDLPGRRYVNGKENIVDVSDIEELLVYEVDSIMKQLGYNEIVEPIYYHFLIPWKALDVGLEALGDEVDVLNFSKLTIDEEIIDEVRLDDDLIVDPDNAHNEPHITVSLFSLNSRLQIGGNTNLISDDLVVEDDVDVINNDSFDSASDSEDDLERIRRRKLRQLDKEKRVDESVVNRELKMSKNDKVIVTTNCVGTNTFLSGGHESTILLTFDLERTKAMS
uniref:PB1-like domain-containing protein n=1 Tax=Tanacetum cinerariifolium TaxID=118510 RepID=A0A6L2N1E4_TANCI|nr:hypothetical protein [Tanacetum cinerariifolium]